MKGISPNTIPVKKRSANGQNIHTSGGCQASVVLSAARHIEVMMRHPARFAYGLLPLVVALVVAGCPKKGSPVPLRVTLFPYIPDAAGDTLRSLREHIESAFEKQHPEVDLTLRLNKPDDLYTLTAIEQFLTGDSAYDVIEIDAVVLSDLIAKQWIQAWGSQSTDNWHPVAKAVLNVNGQLFGVPHLLCGHFLVTRDATVAAAGSNAELVAALSKMPAAQDMIGDFAGSWNVPALYLDGWADSYGTSHLAAPTYGTLDAGVLGQMRDLVALCRLQQANPCVEGDYHSGDGPDNASKAFARGEAAALIGYSERLHAVLKERPQSRKELMIESAPLGNGSHPLLFVDALVLRSGVPAAVVRAADAFAAFLTSADMQEYLLMSGDAAKGATPRYLLPGTLDVMERPRVQQDAVYGRLFAIAQRGVPYPTTGWTDEDMRDSTRKVIRSAMRQGPTR